MHSWGLTPHYLISKCVQVYSVKYELDNIIHLNSLTQIIVFILNHSLLYWKERPERTNSKYEVLILLRKNIYILFMIKQVLKKVNKKLC